MNLQAKQNLIRSYRIYPVLLSIPFAFAPRRSMSTRAASSSCSTFAAALPRAQGPLAVSGASGHLGLLVVRELLDTFHVPPGDLVAVTRSPQKLAAFAERGVDVRTSARARRSCAPSPGARAR